MDITGARWGLAGAEAIRKLRAIIINADFQDIGVSTWPKNDTTCTKPTTKTTPSLPRDASVPGHFKRATPPDESAQAGTSRL
jgi:hypothetical protein